MVIGGEVDCVKGMLEPVIKNGRSHISSSLADRFTGDTGDFVELKTSISIRGQQDEARFEKCANRFRVFDVRADELVP